MRKNLHYSYSNRSQKHIITMQIERIKRSILFWSLSCSVVFVVFFVLSNVS